MSRIFEYIFMNSLTFLPSVNFVRLQVTFEAIEPIVLPVYKGSAFRGCLGETLKSEACSNRGQPCEKCTEQFGCPFSQLYNSYVPPQHPNQRKYPKSPHPYIIDPMPGNKTDFQPGETFGFVLTLIGQAVDHLPLIIRAFYRMGEKGIGQGRKRFRPIGLQALGHDLNYGLIPYFGQPDSLSIQNITVQELTDQITLDFLNPLRLKEEGNLVLDPPEFDFFIQRLAQRIGLLAHFHCGAPWPEEELKALPNMRWIKIGSSYLQEVDWKRYSGTQDTTMNFDGLIGQITWEGDGLNEWMPLLTLGSFLHAGSTTTFGMGKYSIVY